VVAWNPHSECGVRSAKRYTNVTFTRRVDHEGGRHRPSRAPAEPRACSGCGAVYVRRRWLPPTDIRALMIRASGTATATRCEACRTQASGVPGGYLTVEGEFAATHRDEIARLLRNEAERTAADNPLARILSWERHATRLDLTTTTEHLAARLGHALQKAFGGAVNYGFSHENKLARVTWRRD
jgi:hypothetical protein